MAKNRSFFIEVSKTLKHVPSKLQERSAGEDSTAALLQTPFLAFALGFKVRKHTLLQRSTLPLHSLTQASAKEVWRWFSESACFFSWSATAWGAQGAIWIPYAWHSLHLHLCFWALHGPQTRLCAGSHQPLLPTFIVSSKEVSGVDPATQNKEEEPAALECLYMCAAFIAFTCSRHTNRKAAWRIKGQHGVDKTPTYGMLKVPKSSTQVMCRLSKAKSQESN